MRVHLSQAAVLGLVSGLAVGSVGGAWADSEPSPEMNRVRLQAQSSRPVPNDLMRVVLSAQGEDRDPAKLADTINRTMGWALKKARATEDVTVQSGGYQTYPVYQEGKIVRWRASQQLVLESGDRDRMTRLVGELQSRLQLGSLAFSVAYRSVSLLKHSRCSCQS